MHLMMMSFRSIHSWIMFLWFLLTSCVSLVSALPPRSSSPVVPLPGSPTEDGNNKKDEIHSRMRGKWINWRIILSFMIIIVLRMWCDHSAWWWTSRKNPLKRENSWMNSVKDILKDIYLNAGSLHSAQIEFSLLDDIVDVLSLLFCPRNIFKHLQDVPARSAWWDGQEETLSLLEFHSLPSLSPSSRLDSRVSPPFIVLLLSLFSLFALTVLIVLPCVKNKEKAEWVNEWKGERKECE